MIPDTTMIAELDPSSKFSEKEAYLVLHIEPARRVPVFENSMEL
jgi:hypothetical protein